MSLFRRNKKTFNLDLEIYNGQGETWHDVVADPGALNPEDRLIQLEEGEQETRRGVSELLSQLPERLQTIAVALYTDGKSQAQIAKERGVTIGTINQDVRQIEARMATMLRKEGYGR